MPPKVPNLFIWIADSLRRDHLPGPVAASGSVINTVVNAPKTPGNVPSILSGTSPGIHGCSTFGDSSRVPTVLDLDRHPDHDYDTTFVAGTKGQAIPRLLNYPDLGRSPEDLTEPFVYVEHCWATHWIYGQCAAPDCGFPEFGPDPRASGDSYYNSHAYHQGMLDGAVDYHRDYDLGVFQTTVSFFNRLQQFEAMGVLDDTYVIFTSDHGEAFAEDGRGQILHGFPCPETTLVPTVVYDRDVSPDPMPITSKDILGLWWPDIGAVLQEIPHEEASDLTRKERQDMEATLRDMGYLDP